MTNSTSMPVPSLAFVTGANAFGDLREGSTLTAIDGTLNDSDASIVGYQWQEKIGDTWTDIAGATLQTYTLTETNEGNQIRVVETATDSDGGPSITSTSNGPATGVADIDLAFTSSASIDNTAPRKDDTLSAINGSLNDVDAGVTGYQWQELKNNTWTNIVGATSQTYTVTSDNLEGIVSKRKDLPYRSGRCPLPTVIFAT